MNILLLVAAFVVLGIMGAIVSALSRKDKSAAVSGRASDVALDPQQYQPFKLVRRNNVSHNTVEFRFALSSPSQRVGLPVGKHMLLKFVDAEGKPVSRPYTPVSSDDDRGHFDLLVKLYPQGRMSQHLQQMQIGQTIEARGPTGSLEYKGTGEFVIARRGGVVQNVRASSVGMIAGGSGITPMLQLLRAVHKNEKDATKLALLFANQTEADILLRDELEKLRESRSLTNIVLSLDRPEDSWSGAKGFVTQQLIQSHLPAPAKDTLILLCGPKPMVDAMEKHLLAIGYTEEMYFKY